uniref:Uncharacterized protein n=1 Tax=Arundo donax TaxID=35708 RepID=A0A0A9HG57_ARUDO
MKAIWKKLTQNETVTSSTLTICYLWLKKIQQRKSWPLSPPGQNLQTSAQLKYRHQSPAILILFLILRIMLQNQMHPHLTQFDRATCRLVWVSTGLVVTCADTILSILCLHWFAIVI